MKSWMVVLVLLGMVVFVIAGNLAVNNPEGKAREARLVVEYQAIKHPEGAKLISYELGRKIIIRWIFCKYTYPISNVDVKNYYDQELTGKGWKEIEYNSRPGDVFYAYVKNNLIVVLGPHEGNVWTLSMHYVDAKY